jgi:opacity protein-like surface antigen
MRNAVRRSLAAVALAAAALPAAVMAQVQPAPPAPTAAAKPNFSGTYAFDQKHSDDLREAIGRAVGPGSTLNNKKSEQARVWIHDWLESVVSDPEKKVLTIEHNEKVFASGLGDEVSRYYFGREATSRGPAGGHNKVTVAWQGDQIVTQEKQDNEKGKGSITAIYSLSADKKSLLVSWKLEHESFPQPLEVKLAFERTR